MSKLDHQPEVTRTSRGETDRRHGRRLPLIAGTAVASLVIGGVGGALAMRNSKNTEPVTPATTESAPAVPGDSLASPEAPSANSDITAEEANYLVDLCMDSPVGGIIVQDIYALPQASIDSLRSLTSKVEALPEGEERWTLCSQIANGILVDLGY